MLQKKTKQRLSKDTCWRAILTKFQPPQEITKVFPNKEPRVTLDDLIMMFYGTHTRCGDSFHAIWFMSATLSGIKLIIVKRFVHVIVKGPPDWFFDKLPAPLPSPGTIEGREEEIIGLWFLINTVIGFTCCEYFSSRESSKETFACPFPLGKVYVRPLL